MTLDPDQLFFELFEALPRQGPGSLACAQRAFGLCRDLPRPTRALDLGCGAGMQTLHLASLVDGSILAVDNHAPLIKRLTSKLEEEGLSGRIEARVADMSTLDLPSESFELIWSEGALYNLGLKQALSLCARLLRPGGYLAFTEAVWRTESPSAEAREAFAKDYPSMGRIADVLRWIRANSFELVGHFDLPEEAWWDDFYRPMERQIETLRTKYAQDSEALALLDELANEPQMHRRVGHDYGYTFFIAQRTRNASRLR